VIMYKNGYRQSSWLCLMDGRLGLGKTLLNEEGIQCTTIDDVEFHVLRELIQKEFSEDNILGVTPIKNNPSGRSTAKGFSIAHEYAIFSGRTAKAKIGRLGRSEKQIARYGEQDEKGFFEWVNFRKHGGTREEAPSMFFPIFVSPCKLHIPEMNWNEKTRIWDLLEETDTNEEVIYPIDENGSERRWKWGVERVVNEIDDMSVRLDRQGNLAVYIKSRLNEEGMLPLTWWDKTEYSATAYGTNLLKSVFGELHSFTYPKSIHAVQDSLRVCNLSDKEIALDFFAGSGTTAHAVINLNNEDDGNRKYILIEMGEYFDVVMKPRVQKVVYSKNWKNGKPVSRDGSSHMFKYLRLESYEDTLNNLELKRTEAQQELLSDSESFRESYMLSYMLDVESKDSASLLNVDSFEDPFNYKLKIATGSAGETKPVTVDLVETFNYLIGLTVHHIDHIRGFRVVQGTNPKGEKVLIIWRNPKEKSNEDLDEFFRKQEYNPRDLEFDLIYVNGDNNVENLRREDETWKVRLIEEEFQQLMFDVQDV